MADISKITLPSGSTYDIKDSALSTVVGSRTLVSGQSTHEVRISTVEAAIEALAAGGLTYKIVTSLPTASESTLGSIYLIKHTHTEGSSDTTDKDFYDEYMTIKEGATSYKWEKIGNTDINLSDYAKKGDGITVSSISGSAANSTTGISVSGSISAQGSTSSKVYIKSDSVLGADTTFTAAPSNVTITPSTTDVYSITNVGTANTPTVIDTSKFSGGSFTRGSFSGGSGSFTQGDFSGGSFTQGAKASWGASVSNETLTISWSANGDDSFTPATHGADTHTHTAATHAADTFTKASLATGFYTAGTAATMPSRSASAIKAWTGYTAASAAAQDITVGTNDSVTAITSVAGSTSTGATQVNISGTNSGITLGTLTVTDNGHTHSVSGTGSGTINS